jgi:hypothetical protein
MSSCKRNDYFEETQQYSYSPPTENQLIINIDVDNDDIDNYNDDFITDNIYSPSKMEDMAREISKS